MEELLDLPFDEAVNFWQDKLFIPQEEMDMLVDEVRMVSFNVKGAANEAQVRDAYNAISSALNNGTTLADFQRDCGDLFDKSGWTKDGASRAETVFRTNLQTAYNAGRYEQQFADIDIAPYWMYVTVDDGRVRPAHKALHGAVYKATHSFWVRFYPPNGFNCRCSVVALTEEQVQSYGLASDGTLVMLKDDSSAMPLTVYEHDLSGESIPLLDENGEIVGEFTLEPDEGFAANPYLAMQKLKEGTF